MIHIQKYSKQITYYLLLLSILLSIILTTHGTCAEKTLFIAIYDCETEEQMQDTQKIFYEGNNYDIEIGCEEEPGYVYDATIITPWQTCHTSQETPWATIQCPPYEEDYKNGFTITVTKEGYQTAEETILILKGTLTVTTNYWTAKEGDSFSVTVTDQKGNRIHTAQVFLEHNGQEVGSATTNTNGLAYLEAPALDKATDILIRAFQEGYNAGTTTIHIEPTLPFFYSEYTPMIVALLILIGSILFVRIRQRHTTTPPQQKTHTIKTTEHPTTLKTTLHYEQTNAPPKQPIAQRITIKEIQTPERGSRVEEIRFHSQDIKKTTNYLPSQNPPEIPHKPKNDPNKWIEGTPHAQYKIDELTGKLDTQKKDKWFEGIDNMKLKVDEQLKKNTKKKNT